MNFCFVFRAFESDPVSKQETVGDWRVQKEDGGME